MKWKKYYGINLLFVLFGLIGMVFSLGGDLNKFDWLILLQNISLLLITIGFVDFLYKLAVKEREIEIIGDTTKELTDKIETRVKEAMRFPDSGLIAFDKNIQLLQLMNDLEDELLLINTFIPEFQGVKHVLKRKISNNQVKRINIYVLDFRPESTGLTLLNCRASTFEEEVSVDNRVKRNIKVLCKIAKSIQSSSNSLTEFNIHLYNRLPSLALWQFSSSIARLSFFFYERLAIDGAQFVIDLEKQSDLIDEVKDHIKFLKESVDANSKFNLLESKEITRLESLVIK